MIIYVWSDGTWCYDDELHVFHWLEDIPHKRIDLDNIAAYQLTQTEQQACLEALGE